jgi:ferredoxin-NADP reductase
MTDSDQNDGVLDLQVRSMTIEADGVLSLELVDPDGGLLPPWTAGAHIDLGLPEFVRQYSLCGDPSDRTRFKIAVLREADSRGGSGYVHSTLRPGDLVEVGGPRNHFPLSEAPEYLFIAGGIGITPLLPMIMQAAERGVPWRLVYGGRTRSSMAFLDTLAPLGDNVLLQPEDEVGRLDVTALVGPPRDDLTIFCCGPTGLIDAVERATEDWPRGALNVERFVGRDLSGLDSQPLTVRCASSAIEVKVAAEQSILDALEDAGLSVANACRDGVCGSCELGVLEGIPDHRDSYRSLDDEDASSLAVCVSRARTSLLVLDI